MSACYEISGVVRVRRGPALDALLAGLRGYFRPGLILAVESEEREPGILTVSLDAVGVFTRGAGVPELDEMVRSLGPHAVEPAIFLTMYEHRPGELVVAPSEEAARAALSRHRREQIEPLSRDLIPADRAMLVAGLQEPQDR
jgi:hypothetical protein